MNECVDCLSPSPNLDASGRCERCVEFDDVHVTGVGSGHIDATPDELEKAKEAISSIFGGTKDYSNISGSGITRGETALAARYNCRLKGSCKSPSICESVGGCADGLETEDIEFILRDEEEVKEAAYGSLCPDCLEALSACECVKADPRPARLKEVLTKKEDVTLPTCKRCGNFDVYVYPVTVRHRDAVIDVECCMPCIGELGVGGDGAVGSKKSGFVVNVSDDVPIYLRKDGAPLFGKKLEHPGKATVRTERNNPYKPDEPVDEPFDEY